MNAERVDVERIVGELDHDLRVQGTADRAEHEKAYLKSELEHYGVRVPLVRSVVKAALGRYPGVDRDGLVALAEALWAVPVHERRLAAAELLALRVGDLLEPADAELVERLLREARTWALVDVLAPKVMGPLAEKYPAVLPVLDRWAEDDDFWLRRAALLALLVPLRNGDGDFERFSRYAEAMLDDKEFFVRKAIGWVLRDTGKKRPDLVFEWLRPRASRASGVTLREALKPLSPEQRTVLRARR